jgi:hypothetical protein
MVCAKLGEHNLAKVFEKLGEEILDKPCGVRKFW